MLHSVKGKIIGSGDKFLIVDVGPLALKIFVPQKTVEKLAKKQDAVTLFTNLHIRENEVSIYGFENERELQLFSLLCSVNGIGPRSALSILSRHESDTIFQAIAEGAIDFLSQMASVGKKKAERIVVELKGIVPQIKSTENLKEFLELEAALANLGYHIRDIRNVLTKLPISVKTFEEKLRLALKMLSE